MSARRILITGATGGLGHALVREALARGHAVRATGRSQEQGARLADLGAEFVSLDLADDADGLGQLFKGCETIIHAAALSASWGPPEAFERANVAVTRELLKSAREAGATRFVFVSSPSIFAAFRDRLAIGETCEPTAEPLNDYARTKLAAERLVLAANSVAFACSAIRPRALVGPGDRVILPRLAELARRKVLPLPGGGAALIELTDLRDAAWAICEAEERAQQIGGKAINVSGGKPVSVRYLASRLATRLGERPRLAALPLALARPVAGALEHVARLRGAGEEPHLTRYTLATLGWSQTFDLEPARRMLGFEPRHDALGTLLDEAAKLAVHGDAT